MTKQFLMAGLMAVAVLAGARGASAQEAGSAAGGSSEGSGGEVTTTSYNAGDVFIPDTATNMGNCLQCALTGLSLAPGAIDPFLLPAALMPYADGYAAANAVQSCYSCLSWAAQSLPSWSVYAPTPPNVYVAPDTQQFLAPFPSMTMAPQAAYPVNSYFVPQSTFSVY
jgi:hypothetical protein